MLSDTASGRMSFSALQRAEIAEILSQLVVLRRFLSFSALQRAEIAEMLMTREGVAVPNCFSALQRAEIAEMQNEGYAGVHVSGFQCSSTSRNC